MPAPVRTKTAAPHPSWVGAALVVIAALAISLAACTASTGTPAPTAGASEAADGSGGPKPTYWPTTVTEATLALAAADSDFQAVGQDLMAAVDEGDMSALYATAQRVQTFLNENRKNIPRLQSYDYTKSVGDRLAAAYDQMLKGIREVLDGLASSNGASVTTGFQDFAAGNTLYSAVRQDLGDLGDQAIFMKRQLLR